MIEGPTELEEVVVEVEPMAEPKNSCYVCYRTSGRVQKSPCVCKTLCVCEECLNELQSQSTVCTVCRTQFESRSIQESERETLIRLLRSFKISMIIFCWIGILALLVFGVGILVFAIDRERWPKIVPEMYGTIFLYGFITVAIASLLIGCSKMAR